MRERGSLASSFNAAKMNTISDDLSEIGGLVANLGTAADRDIGTGSGDVPELDSSGHLPRTVLATGTSVALLGTASGNNEKRYLNVTGHDYMFSPNFVSSRDDLNVETLAGC